MHEHHHDHQIPCIHTIQNLCDVIEVHLGKKTADAACSKMIEQVQKCPTCCAEVETLYKTVKMFQKLPGEDVPAEVENRLFGFLRLDRPNL